MRSDDNLGRGEGGLASLPAAGVLGAGDLATKALPNRSRYTETPSGVARGEGSDSAVQV